MNPQLMSAKRLREVAVLLEKTARSCSETLGRLETDDDFRLHYVMKYGENELENAVRSLKDEKSNYSTAACVVSLSV